MMDYGREAPTAAQVAARLAQLPPERAARIAARIVPAPDAPPPETQPTSVPSKYASWADYVAQTTPADRRRWCRNKASKANGERLMSGVPGHRITTDDVLEILTSARGHCAHCGSLAVEKRPSTPKGAPLPWEHVGRRIGSLGHTVARFHRGSNTVDNLVWSCLWCNTWQIERRPGATDRGGHYPADD